VTYGGRVVYVLHLSHGGFRGMRWVVVVDGRLEGLKVSMVRAVVWWLEYNLGRKLGTVLLPTWELSYVPTVSVHRRDMLVANGLNLNETKWQKALGVTYCKQAICQERWPHHYQSKFPRHYQRVGLVRSWRAKAKWRNSTFGSDRRVVESLDRVCIL